VSPPGFVKGAENIRANVLKFFKPNHLQTQHIRKSWSKHQTFCN